MTLDHKRIEQLLVEAAQSCDLQEPFVHILQLGDFSVTYRVSGFLQETRHLITAQSLLHGCVLDTLHSHGVVIVSPTFMNQRRLEREERILPPHATVGKTSLSETTAAEDIAFDKAEKAKRVEDEKQQLAKEIAELESVIKTETDQDHKSSNLSVLEQKRERLKALETHDKSSEVETP